MHTVGKAGVTLHHNLILLPDYPSPLLLFVFLINVFHYLDFETVFYFNVLQIF